MHITQERQIKPWLFRLFSKVFLIFNISQGLLSVAPLLKLWPCSHNDTIIIREGRWGEKQMMFEHSGNVVLILVCTLCVNLLQLSPLLLVCFKWIHLWFKHLNLVGRPFPFCVLWDSLLIYVLILGVYQGFKIISPHHTRFRSIFPCSVV